jgi:hypothetical protein
MSENKLANWQPDADTQQISDQPPMSLEEFTAQCDRQIADYWKSVMEGKPTPRPRKKVPPTPAFRRKQ